MRLSDEIGPDAAQRLLGLLVERPLGGEWAEVADRLGTRIIGGGYVTGGAIVLMLADTVARSTLVSAMTDAGIPSHRINGFGGPGWHITPENLRALQNSAPRR